jgi:hypothetical protein
MKIFLPRSQSWHISSGDILCISRGPLELSSVAASANTLARAGYVRLGTCCCPLTCLWLKSLIVRGTQTRATCQDTSNERSVSLLDDFETAVLTRHEVALLCLLLGLQFPGVGLLLIRSTYH